jgi:TonB family protein
VKCRQKLELKSTDLSAFSEETNMPNDPNNVPRTFGILPPPERRPGSFVISAILNTCLALLIIILGVITKKEIDKRKYEQTLLVLPEPEPPKPPAPKIKLPPPPEIKPEPIVPKQLEQQKIIVPKQEVKPEPKPEIKLEAKVTPLPPVAAKPAVVLAPQPKAALTAAAPSLTPNAKPKIEQVHFGSLVGVTPNPNAKPGATISAIGNPYGGNQGKVKAPEGIVGSAGLGNGTKAGSNAGTPGRVVSAGIPGGTGTSNGGRPGGGGQVASAGIALKPAVAAPLPVPVGATSTSIELTYKPVPEYTPEARQMKIQGEVVLHVIFTASGQVQVLNVVRGLGHGLDESARRAVQLYKYKPATKDGRPVDLTTNITITFQLA